MLRKLKKHKKFKLALIFFIAGWCVIELEAIVAFAIMNRDFFSPGQLKDAMRSRVVNTENSPVENSDNTVDLQRGPFHTEVIHPYLGFVIDPKKPHIFPVSEFGFFDNQDKIQNRSKDKLIVGIFGASVADGIARAGLKEQLAFSGKNVELLLFTVPGYKQPQQLFTLAYMLSLGAQFDVVVNIDGFNEMVLPPLNNIPDNVFPVYPRAWYSRVKNIHDADTLHKIGRLALIDQKAEQWAKFFEQKKMYYSPALGMLWLMRDRLMMRERYELMISLNETIKKDDNAYRVTGPSFVFQDDDELYQYLANVWQRCSIQMKALCDAHDIQYLHILHPNQYVEGSKPMSRNEKETALYYKAGHGPHAVKGYPYLIKFGRNLREKGVNFYDLTMIFRDVEDDIYKDRCCHINKKGSEIVAKEIARLVLDTLNKSDK